MPEEKINKAVSRLFYARFKLGMFDPKEKVPYANIPFEVNDCKDHRNAAKKAALKSMVLLKNDGMPRDVTWLEINLIGMLLMEGFLKL